MSAVRLFPDLQNRRAFLAAWLGLSMLSAYAAEHAALPSLADLSIEQLMNESVTSVSKKETRLNQAPAAITVVTQEEIRQRGITTIPEALRGVPGVEVARINASQWAISARGFNSQYSNKLLVLMDGRTIYNPAFGGVYWDVQDTAIEDIERIEVIRGPGATLWGANAVNGVINIITKKAADTQGTLLSATVGTEDRPSTTVRHGGKVGATAAYRAYVKYFNRDGLTDSAGDDTPDDWRGLRSGFRFDWEPTREDFVTLQGDYHRADVGEENTRFLLTPPFSEREDETYRHDGANVLGRWQHTFSEGSELSVQSYFDHFRHGNHGALDSRNTADFEFQHRFAWGPRNDVVWGGGYRFTEDELPKNGQLRFDPARRADHLLTAFVQDQIAIVPKRLSLILGSKFEHNDYTGFEIQPSARLLWTPNAHQTVWASFSRAVRTPTRSDTSVRATLAAFPTGAWTPPGLVEYRGDEHLGAENVRAFELGYRVEPSRQVSLDTALFYNLYDDLIAFTPDAPELELDRAPAHLVFPSTARHAQSGETYGAEFSAQWKVTDRWRLAADYSWLEMRIRPVLLPDVAGNSPQQQARLRSYLELPGHLELNGALSYVDRLTSQKIPSYLRLDVGLLWRPTPSVELGVWGQNLLDDKHPESTSYSTTRQTEVPRSVQFKATWRF